MPNPSREFRKEQTRQASWDRMRKAPWSPFDLYRPIGSGKQRIQLIYLPSFSSPAFWEVCLLDSEWVLYSAKVIDPGWPTITVQGYEPVQFDGNRLRSYFDRLASLTLPIAQHSDDQAVLDGETTQLALFGDLFSFVRFQWWSEYPPAWEPLVGITNEMLKAFGSLP
jgi:hypothetical protein